MSQGRYPSDMKPQAALQSIITFMVRYRSFRMGWQPEGSGVYHLLDPAKYLRELAERFNTQLKHRSRVRDRGGG